MKDGQIVVVLKWEEVTHLDVAKEGKTRIIPGKTYALDTVKIEFSAVLRPENAAPVKTKVTSDFFNVNDHKARELHFNGALVKIQGMIAAKVVELSKGSLTK